MASRSIVTILDLHYNGGMSSETRPEQASDTSAKMAAVHIAMLRRAGLARRIKLAFSLSASTIRLSRRAIGRKNTCLSQGELDVLVLHHFYGRTLAEKFQIYLRKRSGKKDE